MIGAKIYLKPQEIEEIKYANRVIGSAVHPDTGKTIPFYMRMSGFVYFNVPIVMAVLFTKNQTPAFNAFLQFVNQTYNAAMNYGNRNASANYSVQDLGMGYTAACVTSVGLALYTRTAFKGLLNRLTGPRYLFFHTFLNFISAAFAGVANMSLMRYKELQDGV